MRTGTSLELLLARADRLRASSTDAEVLRVVRALQAEVEARTREDTKVVMQTAASVASFFLARPDEYDDPAKEAVLFAKRLLVAASQER